MQNQFHPKLLIFVSIGLAIASFSVSFIAKADTVNARCDVFPKGEDRAKSSGLCTFSQRQGSVDIQLENGKRYDLTLDSNQPVNYRDQNGRRSYRQAGLSDKGQIYRLATESIFVYWDTAPYGQNSGNTTGGGSATCSQPDAGTTSQLRDLVGAFTAIGLKPKPTIA